MRESLTWLPRSAAAGMLGWTGSVQTGLCWRLTLCSPHHHLIPTRLGRDVFYDPYWRLFLIKITGDRCFQTQLIKNHLGTLVRRVNPLEAATYDCHLHLHYRSYFWLLPYSQGVTSTEPFLICVSPQFQVFPPGLEPGISLCFVICFLFYCFLGK